MLVVKPVTSLWFLLSVTLERGLCKSPLSFAFPVCTLDGDYKRKLKGLRPIGLPVPANVPLATSILQLGNGSWVQIPVV